MANYATSALKLSDTYVNTLPYNTCSTAAGTAAKTVSAGSFALETGAMVVVKFTVTNTAANPTLNVSSTGAKAIYYNGAAITAGYLKANKVYQFIYNGTQWDLVGDVDTNTTYTFNGAVSTIKDNNLTASRALISNSSGKVAVSDITSTELGYLDGVTSAIQKQLNGKASSSHNHAASEITSGTIAGARLPVASGTAAGITIVWPADSCTTFSSDSGTVTPLAVQKGAKMFAITRPTSEALTVPIFTNAIGDIASTKIKIETVTNTRDTSKTANVLVIPAEGDKKMVYGYCTDQVDGTSFIGGVFDKDATSYPYASGLAIGGTSGNLLWKGKQVATTDMLPSVPVSSVNNSTGHVYVPSCYSGSTAKVSSGVHTLTINEVLSSSTTMIVTVTAEFASAFTSGNTIKVTGKYKSGNTSQKTFTTAAVALKDLKGNAAPTNAFTAGSLNQIMLKLTRSGTTVTIAKAYINSAVATWN